VCSSIERMTNSPSGALSMERHPGPDGRGPGDDR
jgi:hypothetical protein